MQTQKLLDLAEHLEFGKLGHDDFAFHTWSCKVKEKVKGKNVCKTLGCAIGECPTLFPEDWRFSGDLRPLYRDNIGTINSTMDFFKINRDEAEHLFIPMYQMTWLYGGDKLFGDSSKKQVADNIRTFVNLNNTPFKRVKNRLLIKLNKVLETF